MVVRRPRGSRKRWDLVNRFATIATILNGDVDGIGDNRRVMESTMGDG
jgi:hypothetical protein